MFVRHGRRHGLDAERLATLAWWILIAGFAGARLLFVASHPSEFLERPWAVVAVWEGGLEFSGGFLVAAAVVVLWLRQHRDVPALVLTDGVVLGLAVGLAIGRIGCYSVGEHLGVDVVPAGRPLPGRHDARGSDPCRCTHPQHGRLRGAAPLPLTALLLRLRDRVPPGRITAVFLGWYGVRRFTTDLFRTYDREVLGLTGAQFVRVGLVIASLAMAAWLRERSAVSPPT